MSEAIAQVHNGITALFFTILTEVSIILFIIYYVLKYNHLKKLNIIFTGVLSSAVTHPYVSYVFPYLMNWPRSQSLIISEIFAVVVEGILYRYLLKLDWKIAFAISLVCNIISYYLGHFLHSNNIWFYW